MGWLGIGLLLWLPGLLWAAPPDAPRARPASADKPEAVLNPEAGIEEAAKAAKPPPTPVQKRKVIIVTTMIIAGILTVSLLLFLWIMWWSRRTHRLLRQPLPAAKRGDELWYLKAKGPGVSAPPTAADPTEEAPPAPPPDA